MRESPEAQASRTPQYLSDFESNLDVVLWLVCLVAITYAFVQHVMLADLPEIVPWGAEVGDLFYDVSIAYVGAFAFYVLVVVLPLQRDRRNYYQILDPLISRVVGEAHQLIRSLNTVAGVGRNRPNTQENVEETCQKLRPDALTDELWVPSASGFQQATVMGLIGHHVIRAREVNQEILTFASHLDSELISYLVAIEQYGYFRHFYGWNMAYQKGMFRGSDLSVLGRPLFDYLQVVDHLDQYRRRFLSTMHSRPPYLISGSNRQSDAVPLRSEMDG